jgi:hypothetical protein
MNGMCQRLKSASGVILLHTRDLLRVRKADILVDNEALSQLKYATAITGNFPALSLASKARTTRLSKIM